MLLLVEQDLQTHKVQQLYICKTKIQLQPLLQRVLQADTLRQLKRQKYGELVIKEIHPNTLLQPKIKSAWTDTPTLLLLLEHLYSQV